MKLSVGLVKLVILLRRRILNPLIILVSIFRNKVNLVRFVLFLNVVRNIRVNSRNCRLMLNNLNIRKNLRFVLMSKLRIKMFWLKMKLTNRF